MIYYTGDTRTMTTGYSMIPVTALHKRLYIETHAQHYTVHKIKSPWSIPSTSIMIRVTCMNVVNAEVVAYNLILVCI